MNYLDFFGLLTVEKIFSGVFHFMHKRATFEKCSDSCSAEVRFDSTCLARNSQTCATLLHRWRGVLSYTCLSVDLTLPTREIRYKVFSCIFEDHHASWGLGIKGHRTCGPICRQHTCRITSISFSHCGFFHEISNAHYHIKDEMIISWLCLLPSSRTCLGDKQKVNRSNSKVKRLSQKSSDWIKSLSKFRDGNIMEKFQCALRIRKKILVLKWDVKKQVA